MTKGTKIGQDKGKILHISLSISFNIHVCLDAQKNDLTEIVRSFGYPQNKFWLRNKNINFQLCTLNQRPVITAASTHKV